MKAAKILFLLFIIFIGIGTEGCQNHSRIEKETDTPKIKEDCSLDAAKKTSLKMLFQNPKSYMQRLINIQVQCKSRFVEQNSDIIGLLEIGDRKIIRVHALNPEIAVSKIKARKFENKYNCLPLMLSPATLHNLNKRTSLRILGIPVNLGLLEKRDVNLSTGENFIIKYQYIDIELIELH